MKNPAFPPRVILEVPQYYEVFQRHFTEPPPSIEDFQELLRQIIYELLNSPYDRVILGVGFLIPQTNLMRDKRLETNPALANQLTLAAADITAKLCDYFRRSDLFDINGTLSYTPRNIHHDIMVLDYVTGG